MSSTSLLRAALTAAACMLAAAADAARAAPAAADLPGTTPAERTPSKPDADVWARRNIELLRWAVDQPDRGRQGLPATVFGSSLHLNTLLMRDPYAAEVVKLVEKYQSTIGERAKGYARYVALLRLPEAQRLAQLPLDESGSADRMPDGSLRPPRPYNIASQILNLPRDIRAAREPALLEQMESAAREQKEWRELAVCYQRLASFALHDDKAEQAGRYIDRLMAILRDHAVLQNPPAGSEQTVEASGLADLMLRAGRRDEFEKFMEAQRGDVRVDLAVGLVAAQAGRGDFEAVRAAIARQLRPVAPDGADRLLAALEGKIVLPPPPPGKRVDPPRAESRLRAAQWSIASGHAAGGDVDTAGRMGIELQRDHVYHHVGKGRLAPFEWSPLAMRAAEKGHKEAARRGFEHAIESMDHDTTLKADEREERARLIREAVSIGNYKIADRMLTHGSRPGASVRLEIARTYREQGKIEKFRAMLDEALAQARRGDGSAMAGAAVELHALGDVKRAETILLDALGNIEGVDFGFGGTGDVVIAAMKMGRLDLLDKLYAEGDPGTRLLLCIVASRAAVSGIGEER